MSKVAESCRELCSVELSIECGDSPLFEQFLAEDNRSTRVSHPDPGLLISFLVGLSASGVQSVYYKWSECQELVSIGRMWTLRRVSQRPGVQFMEIHWWWRRRSGRNNLSVGRVEPKDEDADTGAKVPNFGSFHRCSTRIWESPWGISLLREQSACKLDMILGIHIE
jgi:hypothetical protein